MFIQTKTVKRADTMSPEYDTIELARIYESQGYFQDALDIYARLNREARSQDPEIRAAVSRMEQTLARKTDAHDPEKRAAKSLEQWIRLLILEKRLHQFKTIQSGCRKSPESS